MVVCMSRHIGVDCYNFSYQALSTLSQRDIKLIYQESETEWSGAFKPTPDAIFLSAEVIATVAQNCSSPNHSGAA